jgi:hypothetical protein
VETTIDKYHLGLAIDTQECHIPEDVQSLMQPVIDRVGHAVEGFPESHLSVTVVYHPGADIYHAQAKLNVPGETFMTGAREEYIDAAIRHSLEKIAQRAESYRDDPDRDAVVQARRDVELSDVDAVPMDAESGELGRAVQNNDYRAFRQAMLHQEEPLRKRVGRWVQRYPQVQELIGLKFEIADLVEEVFLLAFERYPDRPTHLTMHEWLDSLIDPAVKSFWYDPDDRDAVSFAKTLADQPPSDLDVKLPR